MAHDPVYAIALDTSAYTTSVALVGSDGHIAHDGRTVLNVPAGQRGLRQSEALFQHIVNLPELMEDLRPLLRVYPPAVVGVSNAPRNLPDSYMPVFRAGLVVARSLAAALDLPLRTVSHQEGHIWAAFLDHGAIPPAGEEFLAVHISGGTTEALLGSLDQDGRIALRIIGATGDLTAGQFVDRVGVALGLAFPAGAALEQLAAQSAAEAVLPVKPAVQGSSISFSGPLTAIERLIEENPPAVIARTAQEVLANGLSRWIRHIVRTEFSSPPRQAYWVGGVAANQTVQRIVIRTLLGLGVAEVIFARPSFSTDNALGIGYHAAQWVKRLQDGQ